MRSQLIEEHESKNTEISRKKKSDGKTAAAAATLATIGSAAATVAVCAAGAGAATVAVCVAAAGAVALNKAVDAASAKTLELDRAVIERRVRLAYPSSDECISADEEGTLMMKEKTRNLKVLKK